MIQLTEKYLTPKEMALSLSLEFYHRHDGLNFLMACKSAKICADNLCELVWCMGSPEIPTGKYKYNSDYWHEVKKEIMLLLTNENHTIEV